MRTGFYPGCSMKGSAREYNESLMAVAAALGRDLPEVPDWNCCGATAAHNLDRDLSLALPARILAAAEKEGMNEVLVPCAACYSRLKTTRHELNEDEALRRRIAGLVEAPYEGSAEVVNIIEWLGRIPDLEGRVKKPFARKVACYYGCLLVRPAGVVRFDRPEEPQSMDRLMKKLGADPIDWAFKTECCGAGFSVSRTDLVAKLSGLILEDAVSRGAEAVIVACPMCHLNLDMRRPNIEKRAGKKYRIPVMYITQALGLALGLAPRKLGLQRHKVSPSALIVPASAQSAAGSQFASGDSPASAPSSGSSAGSPAATAKKVD
ncbi:MAG: CoB--CoM heterodisulfide reductase iron-sulfur subunit B family protein [Candidatus Aminicenantes bacterium]|nr:CoB--CoM heterodisulfide reductase iron-sulfur subunit B family protein [Candidatus Aminicenantes bacterium]